MRTASVARPLQGVPSLSLAATSDTKSELPASALTGAQQHETPGAITRLSPASSTAATPQGSPLIPSALHQDDASDSGDSESSSQRSVSSFATQAESPGAPFGIHLEWKLKMMARLPQATQVSLQRGLCPGCQCRLPPASLFNAPRYCHYLSCYFCTNCHLAELRVIPARVAERWDFEPRKVSAIAAKYLDAQVNQPLVSIIRIKQTKVSSQQMLTEIHNFRQKLTRLKQCVAKNGCDFKEKLDGFLRQLDAHVAQGHEYYAMQDLIRIELQGRSCPLYVNVSRLVKTASQHVTSCPTCSSSGQICPICTSETPVFPFEIQTFHSCPQCGTAFHRACFERADSECPFCLQSMNERGPSVAKVRAR